LTPVNGVLRDGRPEKKMAVRSKPLFTSWKKKKSWAATPCKKRFGRLRSQKIAL
jgi:hypothetical protein